MSPTRERYAVGMATRVVDGAKGDVSVTVGIAYEDGDDVDALSHYAQNAARFALAAEGGNHPGIVHIVELHMDVEHPQRPFYVETDEAGRGVQVYQPYGMPQNCGDGGLYGFGPCFNPLHKGS